MFERVGFLFDPCPDRKDMQSLEHARSGKSMLKIRLHPRSPALMPKTQVRPKGTNVQKYENPAVEDFHSISSLKSQIGLRRDVRR